MAKIKNSTSDKWLVVVNPNAGSRKGEKDWPKIEDLLKQKGFSFESFFTQNRNHAIKLTAQKITEGFRKVIVVGGDGTLNEVVNGVYLQEACKAEDIILAMIPVGTGNDWCRMYEIPKKYAKAIKVIRKGHLFTQDVGFIKYNDSDGEHERYFINVSGMGYDALVAQKTNKSKDKGRGSSFSYFLNIFTGLYQYKSTPFRIEVDGSEVYKGRVLSMNIGICKYNGGGMMQLPNAIPDDGLLDVTIIKGVSKLNIFKHVTKLYDGSLVKLKFVLTFRGKECRIISRPRGSAYLEADGESLGHSPLVFSVKQKALHFIIPAPDVLH